MGSRTKKAARLVKAKSRLLKLDLACGQNVTEGFEGVDIDSPKAKYKVDLLKFPWPWADNSVEEIVCNHFIEHIPMVFQHTNGDGTKYGLMPADGQDLLFAFFDELYRVLHKEGTAKIVWPSHRSDRAFWDPTHRRFIPQQMVQYLSREWRKSQNLDHYNLKCNFAGNCVHSCLTEMMALSQEVQARRFNEGWNTTIDFIATLKPIKE